MNSKVLLIFISLSPLIGFSQQSQPQKVKNIEAFAKLYGYVKYFHPSDEAFDNDWDYFAIYGATKVLDCPDNEALRDSLIELFQPIAPSIQITKGKKGFNPKNHYPKDTTGFERVFWQHQGVNYGNFRNAHNPDIPFHSVRVNKPYEVPVANDTAGFAINLKVDSAWWKMPYRITGNFRFSQGLHHRMGYGNQGQFFAEIDHKRVSTEILPGPYSNVEMTGRFPSKADTLRFGAIISGGVLRFNDIDIKVRVDGVWKDIDSKVNAFERHNILSQDWFEYWGSENFTFDVLKDIEHMVLKVEGQEKYIQVSGDKLFQEEPNDSDHIQVELIDGVHAVIPYVLYSNFLGTYPTAEGYGALAVELENTEYHADYLGSRLGNVINAWNVFKFFYPYIDLINTDWNVALLYSIKSVLNGASTTRGIEIMTHYLEDAHVKVEGEETFYYPPILWERLANGKLVITYVGDENSGLRVGDVVTGIDDMSVDRIYSDVYSSVSTFSEDARRHQLNMTTLRGRQSSKMKLVLENRTNRYVVRDLASPVSLPDRDQVASQWLDNENSVLYFNWGLVKDELEFTHAMEQMKSAKYSVLDFRDGITPVIGQVSIEQFLRKAFPSPETSVWTSVPRRINADSTIGNVNIRLPDIWIENPEIPGFTCQMICLVDGGVKGLSESIIMGLEQHRDDLVIVGKQSAGANGLENRFILPGDMTVSFTGVKTVKPDGSSFFGVGIMPDIKVENTVESIKGGRDLYIDKAMHYIKQAKK